MPSSCSLPISSTPFSRYQSESARDLPSLSTLLEEDQGLNPALILDTLLRERHVKPMGKRAVARGTSIRIAATRVASVYQHLWAKSTLRNRQGLWQRFMDWLTTKGRTLNDHNATLFIESTTARVQGKHQYAKDLRAILNRMAVSTTHLSIYAAGLRGKGALIPIHQSAPLSIGQVIYLVSITPYPRVIAIMVAWKTASRWDEVHKLCKYHFVHVTDSEVIIDWLNLPKSSRTDPYRPGRYTVITGKWTAEIAHYVRTMRREQSLTSMTTAQMEQLLIETFGPNYGSHSFKHGAINVLAHHAAEGLISRELVSLMAKHSLALDLANTTIRYVQDKRAAARMLGTQNASKLL